MIILDTNVVSEPKRPSPEPSVTAWIARQDASRVYVTATVICELSEGIERLPAGGRRRDLEDWLDGLTEHAFRNRILAVDERAARRYGRVVAAARAAGYVPSMGDAQIAAVAALHGMAVATRDVEHFAPFGIPIVNPWTDA